MLQQRVPSLPVVGNVHWIIKWLSRTCMYYSHSACKGKSSLLFCDDFACCVNVWYAVEIANSGLYFVISEVCKWVFFFKRTFNYRYMFYDVNWRTFKYRYMFYHMNRNIVLTSLCLLYGLCSQCGLVCWRRNICYKADILLSTTSYLLQTNICWNLYMLYLLVD